ncbi:hypothetical protein GCM10008018_36070 [Paenibacillus marchantiophytorum]|uniref:Copper amine oxidase N-terminal domain-containing protein n=1 Tax=Paenibacillus marchantiophytorum TaxID=1619310 RepID=A0ABQ1EV42_9BACL|nr:hypothetical protein [Paenibacillus marchantiophytorum]GFZ86828.1 hypothetical protein GCM10008018_36070 [Paenibacillus marchantiophytorum]
MSKNIKRLSVMLALFLSVSVFASLTASAANEKRIDAKNGNYVTISNLVETKKTKDVGYGDTLYVVTAPVTITFHGELSPEASIAKWVDDESLDYVEIHDNKAVLTEDVKYGIFPVFKNDNSDDNAPILLQVVAGTTESKPPVTTTEPEKAATPSLAAPTAAKVLVNGKNVSFEAYNINENNYFKLRDLTFAVNGTEKNFEVSWDAAKNAIALISKRAYTPEGTELVVAGQQTSKPVTETKANVTLDGKDVKFTAYNIDGSNYFKLRDIAQLMNIGVSWNAEAGSIGIDTKAAYTE